MVTVLESSIKTHESSKKDQKERPFTSHSRWRPREHLAQVGISFTDRDLFENDLGGLMASTILGELEHCSARLPKVLSGLQRDFSVLSDLYIAEVTLHHLKYLMMRQ